MALLGDRVFKEITKLKWLLVGALVQYDRGPLIKGKFRHRCTQGEQDMKTMTEIRVMLPQVKEPHNASKAPEVRRPGTEPSHKILRRNQYCQHPDLGPTTFIPVRHTFLLFKSLTLCYFVIAISLSHTK